MTAPTINTTTTLDHYSDPVLMMLHRAPMEDDEKLATLQPLPDTQELAAWAKANHVRTEIAPAILEMHERRDAIACLTPEGQQPIPSHTLRHTQQSRHNRMGIRH